MSTSAAAGHGPALTGKAADLFDAEVFVLRPAPRRTLSLLVDSGSAVSILPRELAPLSLQTCNLPLIAANGSSIPIYGQCLLEFSLMRRVFQWNFIVAKVARPILGVDFLNHYHFLIDTRNKRLVDEPNGLTCSLCSVPDSLVMPSSMHVRISTSDPHWNDLINDFACVFGPPDYSITPFHDVSHRIHTEGPPTYSRPRPLPPAKLAVAKSEFESLLSDGVIQRSTSPWASPLHLVPKSVPNTWRPCGDYRMLNRVTIPDRYPVPHLQQLLSSLHGSTLFTKLDLVKAFYQVPVHPEDVCKTAISVPFGLFEFSRMPPGLRNAPQTFQRLMDRVFHSLPFVKCFIDDILIASNSMKEHVDHVKQVLTILRDNGLRASLDKCSFGQNEIVFLGHTLSADGLRIPDDRIKHILDLASPESYSDLRRHVGLFNFYRRFVPHFSQIILPLQNLLTKLQPSGRGKSVPWEWDTVHEDAFHAIKSNLASKVSLHYPDPNSHVFTVTTDASLTALGASLHQEVNGDSVPLSFFSSKLSPAEQKYSTFDRELLGVYRAVKHFQPYITGQQVIIFTDHKPIVAAFHAKQFSKNSTPRRDRQFSFLLESVDDIVHISGADNIVADALSRPVSAVSVSPTDLPAIAASQVDDPQLLTLRKNTPSRFQTHPIGDLLLYCEVSTPYPRPWVSNESQRTAIIREFHDLCHPSWKRTSALVKSRYCWPELDKSIKEFCRSCETCQKNKTTTHIKTKPIPFQLPSARFETVHLDLVGPLPASGPHLFRYLLTMIDRETLWLEAIPLADITADSVATAFLEAWITRFGVPLHIITDRGTQFESELMSNIGKKIGFFRLRSASFHPQTNGLLERQHRVLKQALRGQDSSWILKLPSVLMAFRMLPSRATGLTPFFAVTGASPMMPIPQPPLPVDQDFLCRLNSLIASELQKGRKLPPVLPTPACEVPPQLKNADYVWLRVDRVRKSLEAPYQGPYRVISINGKTATISVLNTEQTVSVERLKKAIIRKDRDITSRTLPPNKPGDSLSNDSPTVSPFPDLPVSTRSGRRVRFAGNPELIYY